MTVGTTQTSAVDGYAAALLDIAGTHEDPSASVDELHRVLSGLGGNAELVEALADARIPAERKQGIVDDILGGRAMPLTVAAVNFIVAAGAAKQLQEVAARLAEMAADAEGEVVAEVRSPMELDAEQVQRLQTALANATGRKIQVKVVVDPSVVGGVVAKVGDTVLDGSVRHRFTELREQWG